MLKFPFLLFSTLLLALTARAQGLGPLGPPLVWQFDSARTLQELPGNAGAPWLSVDGKRLYYEDSSGFRRAARPAVGQRFGAPRPVRGLATSIPSILMASFARYSDDERTVWYAGVPGLSGVCFYDQYRAERASDTAAFANIRVLKSGYQKDCDGSLGAWLQFFTPTPDGQRAFATMGGDRVDLPLLELAQVGPDSFLVVRSLACCRRDDWLRAEGIQLLDSGRQILMVASYAFPQPGGRGLFLLSRPTVADTFGLPQPIQLPVLQHLPHLEIAYAHYRPDIGVLALALNYFRSNGAFGGARLWILEGQQRPQGLTGTNTQSSFGLTPNPAHHTVRLTGLPPGATTAHVIDAVGRTVRTVTFEPRTSNLELPLEGLPPGLYTVRVGTATRRLVVE